jgi:Transglycosylase-like domain
MRRALALALTTSLAVPATAVAAKPFQDPDLSPTPFLDKSLIAHQRAAKARRDDARDNAPVAIPGYLAAIAACESGGNPRAIGGGGLYRGLFQISIPTWQSVGGQGDPVAASVAEQVRRATTLYAREGSTPWPVCGA